MEKISLALAIFFSSLVLAFLTNSTLDYLKAKDEKLSRDNAVTDCLQAAQYRYQEPSKESQGIYNSTEEPSRYWYKLCMQEKGYEVRVEL